MEVSENLCETGPDAVYDFAKEQLLPPSLGEVDPGKMAQYSEAMEVFEKLCEISGETDTEYSKRSPNLQRKNGAGSISNRQSGVAFLGTEDRKFLDSLSEFFEKVDQVSIFAHDNTDNGDVVLTLDWGVKDVYI